MSLLGPHFESVRQPRLAHELLRLITATAWLVALTLWCYIIYAGLVFLGADTSGPLVTGYFLATVRKLWLIAFFPSLAFAVGWYAVTYAVGHRRGFALPGRRVELLAAFIVGSAVAAFFWRITPLPILVAGGGSWQPPALVAVYWGVDYSPGFDMMWNRLLSAGVLGAVVVSILTWRVIRRHRGRTDIFMAFVLISSVAALVMAASRGHQLPIGNLWPAVLSLEPGSTGAMPMFEANTSPAVQRSTVRRFLMTRDPDGQWLGRSGLWYRDDPFEACGLVHPPFTAIATFRGIVIDLSARPPEATTPNTVVEVPLSGREIRVYKDGEDDFRVLPIEQIDALDEEDWLILKADADLKARQLIEILQRLESIGVRRLNLAAWPVEFAPAESIPRVVFESPRDIAEFNPMRRDRGRNIVKVRKFIRLPYDDRQVCVASTSWDLKEAARRYVVGESVADTVALSPSGSYQDLIARIDRAILGGAKTIYLPAE